MITYASYNRFHNPVVSGKQKKYPFFLLFANPFLALVLFVFCPFGVLIAKWTHQLLLLLLLALGRFFKHLARMIVCPMEQHQHRNTDDNYEFIGIVK